MLLECFEKIRENKFVKGLREFLHSIWYIVLIALLMVCANLFSWELPVFYLYVFFGLLIVLFDDDLQGLMPVICCCYMAISYENNPAMNVGTSSFYDPAFKLQLIFIIALAAILISSRLITLIINGEKKKIPALTFGFAALGAAFMLGGVISKYYNLRTVFFGFVILASLCAVYFLMFYGVNWKKVRKDYFAYLFFILGLFLLIELAGIYVKSDFLETHDRGVLQTGWGMYNNVGCVLAMCLPAALYLSATKKHGWAYMIAALVLVGGLVLSQSRNSMLFGGIIFGVGLVIALVKCSKRERFFNLIVLGAALLVVVIFAIIVRDKLHAFFTDMMKLGFFSDNGRYDIYRRGFTQFKEEPLFGIGFYECDAFRWGSLPDSAFLPPRYHNTIVQMLASCGVFGLICYLFHRFQTVWLLFRRPSLEKTFIALSISALLLTSLVECHFFSFGPGLLYAVLLVCAEGIGQKNE